VPRVGEHIIFLGKAGDYDQKFERLEKFYKKALNEIGWNKYSRISLEFDNQIICTKK
jgi:cell division protein FtsQ